MAQKLTDLQKADLYKALASKSYSAVGFEFGMDKWYPSKDAMKGAVAAVYKEVRNEPEKFGIGHDVVQVVESGIASRKSSIGKIEDTPSLAEQGEVPLTEMTVKELVVSGRKKAWLAVHRKLDAILSSKSELKKQPIAPLTILAGMSFDKGRLLEGESTENFAIKGVLKEGMTSAELMEVLLKNREITQNKDQV